MIQSKTFYLIRHGIATYSTHGYGKRKLTAPILPEAVPIISKLATSLKDIKNSLNISSEIIRCRETSALISTTTGKQFSYDKRLNEEYHETIGEIRTRIQDFLNDMKKRPETNIIICTHGAIIAGLKNLLINGKFVTKHLVDYPPTGTVLIIKDRTVQIENFN